MLINVNDGVKSKHVDISNLINEDILRQVFSEEVIEQEVDIEIKSENPVFYKNSDIASFDRDYVVFDVPDKKLELRYDNNDETDVSLFMRELSHDRTFGQCDHASVFNKVFTANIMSRERFGYFEKYCQQLSKDSMRRNRGARPSVDIEGGLYFRHYFSGNGVDDMLKMYTNKDFPSIRKQNSGNGASPFFNNVYSDNKICWNNYAEQVQNAHRTKVSLNSDYSEYLAFSSNLFLGSIFNRDLNTELPITATAKKIMVDYMISHDYSKHVSDDESEGIKEYMINNATNIYNKLDRLTTKTAFYFSTFFDIPFHVFYS